MLLKTNVSIDMNTNTRPELIQHYKNVVRIISHDIKFDYLSKTNPTSKFDFLMKNFYNDNDIRLELKSNEKPKGFYPTYWFEKVKYKEFIESNDKYCIVIFELGEKYYYTVIDRIKQYEIGVRRGLDGIDREKLFIKEGDLEQIKFKTFKKDIKKYIDRL